MSTPPSNPLQAIVAKLAGIERSIQQIRAEADARTVPLKAEAQRLNIAAEVLREMSEEKAPVEASPDTMLGTAKPAKPSTRALILTELGAMSVPLTKMDLVSRLCLHRPEINGGTVGSTLSIMLRDGVLAKDKMNRYGIKDRSLDVLN